MANQSLELNIDLNFMVCIVYVAIEIGTPTLELHTAT